MPTFGHVFYGFCLLIPLMYYTRNNFNYKVAFIFLLNNLYGPDMVALFFGYLPFHGILSYIIIAIPFALVMSYASRFSIVRSDKGFPLKFEDGGISEVSWKNAFCLVMAGSLSHFFIDQFFHPYLEMELLSSAYFNIKIPLTFFYDLSGDMLHTISPLMFIGDVIVITTLILSIYFLRKGYKDTAKLFLIATVLAILSMLLISPLTFFGEKEYAVMIHMGLYIFAPLFLLMYVARDIEDHPIETPDEPKIARKKLHTIVAALSSFFAIFMTLYASIALFMPDFIAEMFGDTSVETVNSIMIFGFIFFVIALIMLIGSVGLFFKVQICRYLTIATSLHFILFGFPFAIALFLCEKDVKAMFKRE
ncbi:MAG: hypothetical protein V3V33_02130 [Candidatus Lokiarchaeia archaeon]